jgi:CBS domain-containing protein
MNEKLEESTIYSYPHGFISKKGEPILVTTLDDKRVEWLIEMYLAYEPRNSFQGLPPVGDAACKSWVQHMIGHGINLVALSFGAGVVGHVALFPIDNLRCEMLVVVSPPFQNTGIGSELVRCAIQLSDEIDFEKIELSVDATNVRARHVYKKSGFEYHSFRHAGEVEMSLDLTRYRDTINVSVATIMNTNVVAIHDEESCREALRIFLQRDIGSLPVIEADGTVVGIISKTDLMSPSKVNQRVLDVLTRDVVTVPDNCPIAKVIRMLQSKRIRCIPVVDREKKLLGIVSRKDILSYYAQNAEFCDKAEDAAAS